MKKAVFVTGLSILMLTITSVVYGQSSSSGNYKLDEQFVGGGGSVDSNSSNFTNRDASGEIGVGESDNSSGSDSYRLQSGYITDADPRLVFIVNESSINFGDLSTTSTATANSTFKVLNYTSYGYVVQTLGDPPSNANYILNNMGSTDASQTGTEQYGINLKANSSPVTFGADPQQVPDSSFSNGGASGGYSTSNYFRYNEGETIASASESSGETDYTVSYIINISNETPGGKYRGVQGFICTGTY